MQANVQAMMTFFCCPEGYVLHCGGVDNSQCRLEGDHLQCPPQQKPQYVLPHDKYSMTEIRICTENNNDSALEVGSSACPCGRTTPNKFGKCP